MKRRGSIVNPNLHTLLVQLDMAHRQKRVAFNRDRDDLPRMLLPWGMVAVMLLAVMLLVTCNISQVMANDPLIVGKGARWSQFLGPNRNGVSDETGLVDRFDAGGPNELWRVKLEGGLSGIAIADGKIFTLAQNEGKQWLVQLDCENGKLLWRTPLGEAYQNAMGDGPRGTPAIHDGVAYAYSGDGVLMAAQATDGKLLWSQDLMKELNCKPSDYGMSCSPLVCDSLVIVHAGGQNGAVVALEQKSGKVRWKAGQGSAGYSSPVLMTLHGVAQVVSLIGDCVLGLDPSTGNELWRYKFTTEFFCNTACPVAIENRVLISAGENHGSVLLDFEPGPKGWKVAEKWTSLGGKSSLRSEWQTPVVVGGALFGFDNVGSAGPITHLTCLDPATGETYWKQLRFGKGNLIAADGKLIMTTVDGEVVLAEATRKEFKELGRKGVVGFTRQAPVLCNGRLYLRDEAEMVCLDFAK